MTTHYELSELRSRLIPAGIASHWIFLSPTGHRWSWTPETREWICPRMTKGYGVIARDGFSPDGLIKAASEEKFNRLVEKMIAREPAEPLENEWGEVCP